MGTSEVMPLMLLSIFYCLYSNFSCFSVCFCILNYQLKLYFYLSWDYYSTVQHYLQILQMCIKKIYRSKPRVYTFFH